VKSSGNEIKLRAPIELGSLSRLRELHLDLLSIEDSAFDNVTSTSPLLGSLEVLYLSLVLFPSTDTLSKLIRKEAKKLHRVAFVFTLPKRFQFQSIDAQESFAIPHLAELPCLREVVL
jgi:hypothetical protein